MNKPTEETGKLMNYGTLEEKLNAALAEKLKPEEYENLRKEILALLAEVKAYLSHKEEELLNEEEELAFEAMFEKEIEQLLEALEKTIPEEYHSHIEKIQAHVKQAKNILLDQPSPPNRPRLR